MFLDNYDLNPFHISMDAFSQFKPFPSNWVEIANFLNDVIDSRIHEELGVDPSNPYLLPFEDYENCYSISNAVFDQYVSGDFDSDEDCPKIIPEVNYLIYLTDQDTGATSPIDKVSTPEGYTAEEYIRDCNTNANDDWCNMIKAGTITLEIIDD